MNMFRTTAAAAAIATAAITGSAEAVQMEGGLVNLPTTTNNQTTFETVSFGQTYGTTPLVFAIASTEGGEPSSVRIRNVSTTGFEIAQVEPTGVDGQHAAMTVHYFVVTPGAHTLADGTIIEAGSISTDTTIAKSGGGFDSVSFTSSFGDTPALLTGIQTMNNESAGDPPPGGPSAPFLNVAVEANSLDANGANLALERGESTTGSVNTDETIGYVAISGPGMTFDVNGDLVIFDALISADNIVGWDDNSPEGSGVTVPFGVDFDSAPLVVASLARRDGADGGWLRRGTTNANGVRLTVDEDTTGDDERNHTHEAASVFAFSQAFVVNTPEPTTAVLGLLGIGAGAFATRRRRQA